MNKEDIIKRTYKKSASIVVLDRVVLLLIELLFFILIFVLN